MAQAFSVNVDCEEQPMCCDISPLAPLMAAGLINGKVVVHRYTYEAAATQPISQKHVFSVQTQKEGQSCRAARFTWDGRGVVSGGEDQNLLVHDLETQQEVWAIPDAHDATVSMIRLFDIAAKGSAGPGAGGGGGSSSGGPSTSTRLMVSGDEEGGLKIWDMRARKQVYSYKKHSDFISDATVQPRDAVLVVTSADGTLSVHDLRHKGQPGVYKYRARSEDDADDELLSCALVKGGKKVVAGCQSGVLNLYSWGYWNDCSDRFPGHPESVDAVVAFDDDTLLTGSSDGVVRVVGVLPNKLLGVIGGHEDFPIEHLAMSADRRVLASTSHDNTVRLWDLSMLHDDDPSEAGQEVEEDDEDDEDNDEEEAVSGGSDGDAAASGSSDGEGEEDQEGVSGEDEEEESEDGDEWEEMDSEEAAAAAAAEQGEGEPGDSGDEDDGDGAGTAAAGSGKGAKGGPSKKPKTGQAAAKGSAAQPAVAQPAAAAPASEDSDGDGDDSDSDSDAGGKKRRKRKQREKTKWTRQRDDAARGKGKGGGNFFADLL